LSELINDLTTLIGSFKEYLKNPKDMFVVNEILRNCKELNKMLDRIK